MIPRTAAGPALAALLAAVPAHADDAEDVVARLLFMDPAESEVLIHVDRGGLLGFLSDRHVIQADRFAGTIVLSTRPGHGSSMAVVIDAASLVVRDAGTDAGDIAKIQRKMVEDVLRVAEHPLIRFRSTKITTSGDDWWVTGRLTLRGEENTVSFPMTAVPWGDALQLAGTVRIRQTDYGIDPVSAGLGTVKVKNELRMGFRVEARPDRPENAWTPPAAASRPQHTGQK